PRRRARAAPPHTPTPPRGPLGRWPRTTAHLVGAPGPAPQSLKRPLPAPPVQHVLVALEVGAARVVSDEAEPAAPDGIPAAGRHSQHVDVLAHPDRVPRNDRAAAGPVTPQAYETAATGQPAHHLISRRPRPQLLDEHPSGLHS